MYVFFKQPDGIAAFGSYNSAGDLNLAILQRREVKFQKSSLLGRITSKRNRSDRLAGSDFPENLSIQVPSCYVLNEIPQQMPHHILGPYLTAPRISMCEGRPVLTDADDDIPIVDTVYENVFVQRPSSFSSNYDLLGVSSSGSTSYKPKPQDTSCHKMQSLYFAGFIRISKIKTPSPIPETGSCDPSTCSPF